MNARPVQMDAPARQPFFRNIKIGLPLFESCCFCIPLQTGTLVLGYLHLIISLIGIVGCVFIITGSAVATSGVIEVKQTIQVVIDKKTNEIDNKIYETHHEDAVQIVFKGAFILAIGIILLLLCIAKFIFVIFLLVGEHSGKPGYIKAYIMYSVVMLVITVILIIVCLAAAAPFAVVFSPSIACVIEIYFLLVIRSYMIKLQDNSEGNTADNRELYTKESIHLYA